MQLGPAGKILLVLAGLLVIVGTLRAYGILPGGPLSFGQPVQVSTPVEPAAPAARRPLTPAEFPPGVVAALEELPVLPRRALRIGVVPHVGAATLLTLAGGLGRRADSLAARAYQQELELVAFASVEALRTALVQGFEAGGVDVVVLPAEELALQAAGFEAAQPRLLALVSESRGDLGWVSATGAAPRHEKREVAAMAPLPVAGVLWLYGLAQAALAPGDLEVLQVADDAAVAQALKDGKATLGVGALAELEPAVHDKGRVLWSTATVPHLVHEVLVARGDVLARWPESLQRLVRGLLDQARGLHKDPAETLRWLGTTWPQFGDPALALKTVAISGLQENLGFLGVAGPSPVRAIEVLQAYQRLGAAEGRLAPESVVNASLVVGLESPR
jgi:hypothetical protein